MSLWKDKQKEYNMKSLVKLINESNYGPFGTILDYNYLCLYLMFEYFKKSFGFMLGIGAGIIVSNMIAMMVKPETKKTEEDEEQTEEN